MRGNTRTSGRRAWARGLAVGVLVVVAAGCGPIRWNPVTQEFDSFASYQVDPTMVTVGGQEVPAITITIRRCDRVDWNGYPSLVPGAMRPVATVTDVEAGERIFGNGSLDGVAPDGATLVRGHDEVPSTITVPVGDAATLAIGVGCTGYPGIGTFTQLPHMIFEGCTTTTRSCPRTTEGTFHPS